MTILRRMFNREKKNIFVYLTLLILLSHSFVQSQSYIPGQVYYGRNNYVEYHAGDLPLIFSAPHGGKLTPSEIPDRTYGTTVTDSYTKETVLAIRDAVFNYTNHYPHVIISNLKRTKLDPNREIGEAAQGNQWAEQAWYEYHGFIDSAKAIITKNFGKGLYVDQHGHGHSIKRLELGYLLTSANLSLNDNQLNSSYYINKSSIRALAYDASVTFSELVRGSNSLGALFEERGIPAVPSLNQQNPGSGNPFFSGGYSTRRHGSRDGGTISGLQIEAHKVGIRDTQQNRERYAAILTEVLDIYFREHFGWAGIVTNINKEQTIIPNEVILYQNYPNPFRKCGSNSLSLIQFTIPTESFVVLKIYNVLGEEISTLINNKKPPGIHSVELNYSNLATGIYFYVLKTKDVILTKKLLIIE